MQSISCFTNYYRTCDIWDIITTTTRNAWGQFRRHIQRCIIVIKGVSTKALGFANKKPGHVMICGCIIACGIDDLHMCKGATDTGAHTGIWETYDSLKATYFPGNSIIISAIQCQPSFCMCYIYVVCRNKVCALDCSACSPDLSPIKNVWCIINKRIIQKQTQKNHAKTCSQTKHAITLIKMKHLLFTGSKILWRFI